MNPTRFSRLDIISIAMIAATLLLVIAVYPQLPEQMPVHWNSAGEIDGYSSRTLGAFLMPAIAILVVVIFKVLPAISPLGFKLDESRAVVDIIQTIVVALFCVIGNAMVLIAIGYKLNMPMIILIGVGLMLAATGNVLSKVRKNFFVGIRTPWTLADDEVWARTHRLAGRTFFAGGLLICAAGLFQLNTKAVLVVVLLAVLTPVVYSFVIYRQLHSNPND